ncbi:MAG: hypothetical protein J0H65_15890, partial [Rhizobiales bacterium]|nr:hypothetical protein [Hyphomicrobiales bacterium]
LARLDHPVVLVPEEELASWFSRHPDGVAIIRSKSSSPQPDAALPGKVLYRGKYRLQEEFLVVSAPTQ